MSGNVSIIILWHHFNLHSQISEGYKEMENSFEQAPDHLPEPIDDGAATHLMGMQLPDISLPATTGKIISLAHYADAFVLYIYPMTGVPGTALPEGWDDMPGARGCTPQSCALRDYYAEIKALGAELIGLSSQNLTYQQEMAHRLHLTFPVLSDTDFTLAEKIQLPSFTLNGVRYLKRLTMICKNGVILATHYPVFPSTSDPLWLAKELPKVFNKTV